MNIILASKSNVRKKILQKNNINPEVIVSNVDEDEAKKSLLVEGASPLIISKNLAELKSIKVSRKNPDRLVLGADSVVSLNEQLINKPKSREEALTILKKLNNSKHYLISSVCISKNGSMIWNHSDQSELKMKNFKDEEVYFSLSTNDPLVIKKNIFGSDILFVATQLDGSWTNKFFNEFVYDLFLELVYEQVIVNES